MKPEKVFEQLQAGAHQIIPADELQKKLSSGKKLRIKLGMDPTAPDLHLGHAVVLSKMKQFQDLGHEIIFLIGDFTARIGDPSGRSKTRPALTKKEIAVNIKTYFDQVGKILDNDKITIRYNSEWLDKLSSQEVVKLCGQVTLARVTERDDFEKRIKEKIAIGFHELLYPLFQGYDSVALQADVELGGTDQTFNLLMGRHLQQQYGQEPQVVLTTPLLEGLDGVQKMSKSLGNAIGLTEEPDQVFGKLMSVSDKLTARYMTLLLNVSEQGSSKHPMELKKDMAHGVVARFWSKKEADTARAQFEDVFQKGDLSKAQAVELPAGTDNPIWVVDFLKALGAIKSSSEAKRLIESGAVHIDEQKVTDFKARVSWQTGMQIKVGKHRIYTIK